MGNPVQTLPISAAALREVDLFGVFRYAREYGEALKTIAEHPFLMRIVTQRFMGFTEINHAFDVAAKPNDEHGKMTLKVLIDFHQDA
jgi:L-iditol 2-dehydrogenase